MTFDLPLNQYPPDWQVIAARVKLEAGNRCIRCGHPDEPPWKVPRMVAKWRSLTGQDVAGPAPCDEQCTHPRDGKQRMLTVHHLDGDKGNCAWWNLTALCQSCHLTIQGRVIMERTWMLEHSDWFKPYVAGYYAHWLLGFNDRAWVMARVDTLIALGQGKMRAEYMVVPPEGLKTEEGMVLLDHWTPLPSFDEAEPRTRVLMAVPA